MGCERSREARLRRLAREEGKSFHKAERPFYEWGVGAKYYVSDMTNTLVAVYATLDAAEEDLLEEASIEGDVDRASRPEGLATCRPEFVRTGLPGMRPGSMEETS